MTGAAMARTPSTIPVIAPFPMEAPLFILSSVLFVTESLPCWGSLVSSLEACEIHVSGPGVLVIIHFPFRKPS
uniref:Uncharacterized protein n=1 Tax=Anguilla anguilla TaxID=7936 RepID=A0A0E9Y168_ANGAN